jgi:hypothetical protein
VTNTQQFLLIEIATTAMKAFGIEPTIDVEDGIVVLRIDPTKSESPFWKAVSEQWQEHPNAL